MGIFSPPAMASPPPPPPLPPAAPPPTIANGSVQATAAAARARIAGAAGAGFDGTVKSSGSGLGAPPTAKAQLTGQTS